MPIYEYQCQACEHEVEVLQKLSDAPLTDCPECAKPELKKKISAAAFRLKGGGWYETDFKTGNKKNLAGSADKAAGGSKTADAGSSGSSGSASTSPASSGSGASGSGSNSTGSASSSSGSAGSTAA